MALIGADDETFSVVNSIVLKHPSNLFHPWLKALKVDDGEAAIANTRAARAPQIAQRI